MFNSIRATGSTIRLPSHIQEKIWKYRRFISDYQKRTGAAPSDAQIRAALSVDAAALAKIREALKATTLASIDAPVDDSDGSLTLGDSLAGAEDLEEDVGRRLDHEKMAGELQRADQPHGSGETASAACPVLGRSSADPERAAEKQAGIGRAPEPLKQGTAAALL